MNWDEFCSSAEDMGFKKCFCVSTAPFSIWANNGNNYRWSSLKSDVLSSYPWAKNILILLYPYQPYEISRLDEVTIDAYYPASQRSYYAVRELTRLLRSRGYQVSDAQDIPAKAALFRTGQAMYGRNGLTSVKGYGTRFVLHTLITDTQFAVLDHERKEYLDDMCLHCGRCMQACPVKAIDGNGRIDPDICIRGYSYSSTLSEDQRRNVTNSLFGCDICQRVCPRNNNTKETAMPSEVKAVLDLHRLLEGKTEGLADLIGKNYAVRNRIIARSILIAAACKRYDTLPLLSVLKNSSSPLVREYAVWAEGELNESIDP